MNTIYNVCNFLRHFTYNLRKIDFTKVECYVARGDTVFIYQFIFIYLTFMGPCIVIIF